MTIDLLDMNKPALVQILSSWGQPTYRASQVWQWLYQRLAASPAEMTNLPLGLRERLQVEARVGHLEPVAIQQSADGETEKWLSRLADGQTIETVLMSYARRNTLCISSQVGCAMGCVFCATGQMGLRRHLTAGEIVSQVLTFERRLHDQGSKLSNIVFMGMGEPLHNYDATLTAVRRLVDSDGLNMGARRLTISTVGLVPRILQLAEENLQVGLAISLHAATDEERKKLLPAARRWPLDELLAAAKTYSEKTGRRITFEWALILNENDTPEQAHTLGRLIQGMLCHVNLIPLNPTAGYSGQRSDRQRVTAFREILATYGIPNTVRMRRGIDIQAGCGQLKQQLD